MKIIYLSIITVIALVVFVPLISIFGIRYTQLAPQPPNSYPQKVFAQNIATGKIIALDNNLSQIGVSIRNLNLKDKNDIFLRILSENKEELRTSKVSGWSVPDGDLVKFEFPEIPNSKATDYLIEISSPDSVEDFPFEIYMTVDKNISSIQYFKPTSRVSLISTIYKDFVKRFVTDWSFAIFYVALLITLSFLVIKKTN